MIYCQFHVNVEVQIKILLFCERWMSFCLCFIHRVYEMSLIRKDWRGRNNDRKVRLPLHDEHFNYMNTFVNDCFSLMCFHCQFICDGPELLLARLSMGTTILCGLLWPRYIFSYQQELVHPNVCHKIIP